MRWAPQTSAHAQAGAAAVLRNNAQNIKDFLRAPAVTTQLDEPYEEPSEPGEIAPVVTPDPEPRSDQLRGESFHEFCAPRSRKYEEYEMRETQW